MLDLAGGSHQVVDRRWLNLDLGGRGPIAKRNRQRERAGPSAKVAVQLHGKTRGSGNRGYSRCLPCANLDQRGAHWG